MVHVTIIKKITVRSSKLIVEKVDKMNKCRTVIVKNIYILGSLVLLIAGYFYEQPYGNRRYILILLICIYSVLLLMDYMLKYPRIKLKYVSLFIITCCIILIEMSSKYAVNYFFHTIYILIIMYVIINYSKKQSILISIILTIASFAKFLELLIIQPTQGNISMFLFFFILQVLIFISIYLAKNYWEESYKTKIIYKELQNTYKQLQAYSIEIKQLTMVEERTKIARDLHDTLGHDMTGLIMQMEMASRFLDNGDVIKGSQLLVEAKQSVRESLTTVRKIVDTLKNTEIIEWTNSSIYELTDNFGRKTNTNIQCDIRGEKNVKPDIGITLYRIIQEALTNAIRHGKANQVSIRIVYKNEYITFDIHDNGSGCKNIRAGNGLKGMNERVKLLNGILEFESNNGFTLKGKIPYN